MQLPGTSNKVVNPMKQRKAEKPRNRPLMPIPFRHSNALDVALERWQRPAPCRLREAPYGRDILPCLGARPVSEIEAPELVVMTQSH
jgi:hypothetical protein